MVTGTNLFSFSVRGQAKKGFGLQVGVNKEFANVLKQVEQLERKYGLPVMVSITTVNRETAFKILMGPFETNAEATAASKKMVRMGASAPWLRSLSGL